MKPENSLFHQLRNNKKVLVLFLGLLVLATSGVVMILISVFERKQEAKNPFFRVVELDEFTEDPAIWGKNFPLQYDSYKRTVDQERTRYGGSEALPQIPKNADPRTIVSQSKLDEDPRLKVMWAGYAFSKDFREERGHAFMLEDQLFTDRQNVVRQPGACIHCHASVYVPYMKAGGGDLIKGFEHYNQKPYREIQNDFKHPVSCIDCHNPTTMELRITRPGFLEGIKALKEFQGIKNYDVNKQATRQEMRSFVCGQCHVEYYFKGPEKRLVYPWANGIQADQILEYYDKIAFKDWTHSESGAPVIKAQHPEFEMWSQGVHARSGVSCSDCHMPYKREGAQKISDHHVRSPLLNVNRSCQTCHRTTEKEILERAELIQSKTIFLRNLAMDAVLDLIQDIKTAKNKGKTDAELNQAREFQRKAQFLLDFVESENSTGFHAPQESSRILGLSIDYARKGQNSLKNKN